MSQSFEKKIKVIDKNLKKLNSNTLNLKDSMLLLKTTTNFLSSAKDLILSQHNTISDESNEFLVTNNLEEYYNELLIRQKQITELTNKYKSTFQTQKNIINEENGDDIDNEKNTLLNKENSPIELGFVIDKNEALMKKGNKDLQEICTDMNLIKKNIDEQGQSINDIGELADINEKKAKNGGIIINDMIEEKNWSKIMLIILNVLLFVLFLGIILVKILK